MCLFRASFRTVFGLRANLLKPPDNCPTAEMKNKIKLRFRSPEHYARGMSRRLSCYLICTVHLIMHNVLKLYSFYLSQSDSSFLLYFYLSAVSFPAVARNSFADIPAAYYGSFMPHLGATPLNPSNNKYSYTALAQ
ncbi:predicted protein [Sclerotinia sclerotiorum 1980 UF-70]|uniref:Uncharacterized protein n=1 Tax=Sclerotinia sclerotiorum (strain ATCC 18683 / 1980 / Ss-1) TaxID=665079 RepID=A7EB79_SCLS1|nr:predicted protein [Sclerotinia sclerotiorum 1980 UF-70]EDN99707.1 predicted protein [Sclerotinia sclerotiorum 1980 UF-70]